MSKIAIVGIGNSLRGDDGVGHFVIQNLRELAYPELELYESDGNYTVLLEIVKKHPKVIFVDASKSNRMVGTITTLKGNDPNWAEMLVKTSTHALSLKELLDMARLLGVKVTGVTIYAIEGVRFDLNSRMTKEVRASGFAVIETIEELLRIKTEKSGGGQYARNVSNEKSSVPSFTDRKKGKGEEGY